MAWVAVSEVATAQGKQRSITRITRTVTTVAMLSGGAAMTSDFRFELGVFSTGFTPTASNKSQWSSHWTAAQRVAYNATTMRWLRLRRENPAD